MYQSVIANYMAKSFIEGFRGGRDMEEVSIEDIKPFWKKSTCKRFCDEIEQNVAEIEGNQDGIGGA